MFIPRKLAQLRDDTGFIPAKWEYRITKEWRSAFHPVVQIGDVWRHAGCVEYAYRRKHTHVGTADQLLEKDVNTLVAAWEKSSKTLSSRANQIVSDRQRSEIAEEE